MSASTPTVQGGLGSRQLGAALAAVALAIVLIAVLIVGLQAASRPQAATVAPAAPAAAPAWDHGSATLGSDNALPARPVFDHGSATWGTTAPVFDHGSATLGSDATRKAGGYAGGLMNPGEIVQSGSRGAQRMTR
jgi:hypothetical protein